MSAPEAAPSADGVRLARAACDVIEWIAFDEPALRGHAGANGVTLAPAQGVAGTADGLTLCVRPGRWLVLTPSVPGRPAAARAPPLPGGCGACVDHSSGLAALLLAGGPAREVLARGCRLDLDARVFAPGRAAATLMVQVAVTLAALPGGFLLLTPASTARHFEDWLAASARPFGLRSAAVLTLQELCGDRRL